MGNLNFKSAADFVFPKTFLLGSLNLYLDSSPDKIVVPAFTVFENMHLKAGKSAGSIKINTSVRGLFSMYVENGKADTVELNGRYTTVSITGLREVKSFRASNPLAHLVFTELESAEFLEIPPASFAVRLDALKSVGRLVVHDGTKELDLKVLESADEIILPPSLEILKIRNLDLIRKIKSIPPNLEIVVESTNQ